MRNAFGRLLVDPGELPFPERVDAYRELSGRLLASDRPEDRALGRGISRFLAGEDHDLARLLGLRPAKGSRTTAQFLVRQAVHDARLCRLLLEAGSVSEAGALVTNGPRSPAAFSRARRRRAVSRHG